MHAPDLHPTGPKQPSRSVSVPQTLCACSPCVTLCARHVGMCKGARNTHARKWHTIYNLGRQDLLLIFLLGSRDWDLLAAFCPRSSEDKGDPQGAARDRKAGLRREKSEEGGAKDSLCPLGGPRGQGGLGPSPASPWKEKGSPRPSPADSGVSLLLFLPWL